MHIPNFSAPQPEPPLRLVRGRHGLFLVNDNDYYIGRSLLEYGEYSELEMKTLAQLCFPGKDVIEIGANIGSLSVPLAKIQRDLVRRLMVVEPVPVIFNNLCANLALNGLDNVVTCNVACADVAGDFFVPPIDFAKQGNFGGIELSIQRRSVQDLRVPRIPLDALVPEGFDVGLIKIDVEGCELDVLKGAAETIASGRPALYLENDRRDKSAVLIDWLWQADYQLWWDVPPIFNQDNFFGKTENQFASVGVDGRTLQFVVSQNMIALPVESTVQVVGMRQVQSRDDWCFS